MADTIEARWRQLLGKGEPQSREVDAGSPLRMAIGVTHSAKPYFAIISVARPGLPELTNAIETTRRQRLSDGKWTLTLELRAPGLTDAFVSLLSDLAAKSASAATEREALSRLLDTLAEWRELLTNRPERLSEGALRGLVAELWFGFKSDIHGRELTECVRAWVGPLGAFQDFQFDGVHYEIKSLRPDRFDIHVSSAEQLDGDGIHLVVVTLANVETETEGMSLPSLLKDIRARLDGADRADFNRRFAALLVDPDDPWYSERVYSVRNVRVFDVRQDFPALKRSHLPDAIGSTKYRLDIQHLDEFIASEISYADWSLPEHG